MNAETTNIQDQQTVETEKETRRRRCTNRIADVLKEENCYLDVSILITSQGNVPQLQVLAADAK